MQNMNLLVKNKKTILLLILILIPVVLLLLNRHLNQQPKTVTIDQKSGPALQYSRDRLAQKLDVIRHHYGLAQEDESVVDKLVKQQNPLYHSDNLIITYNKTEDLFVTDLKTIRIEPAKREGVGWFKGQGLSLEAICALPVTFTINEESAKTLKGLDIQFDPLASECQ